MKLDKVTGDFKLSPWSGADNGSEKGARNLGSIDTKKNPMQVPDFRVPGPVSLVGLSHQGTDCLSSSLAPLNGGVNGRILVEELPASLMAVNDHGTHVAIVPVENMSFKDLQGIFNGIAWHNP